MKHQPLAVSEKEAAAMVRVPVGDFRQWAAAVELQPCLIAGHPRYRVADIEARLRGDLENPEDRY